MRQKIRGGIKICSYVDNDICGLFQKSFKLYVHKLSQTPSLLEFKIGNQFQYYGIYFKL